jgi:hypothetical protein
MRLKKKCGGADMVRRQVLPACALAKSRQDILAVHS